MGIRNGFKKNNFCRCSYLVYLSNDDIISWGPGLKTGVKVTFLGLKQGQDFGEPGAPPPRIPRSTPLPRPPRLLLAIVPFHLVLLFFRDPFSALLDYLSRDFRFNSVYHSRLVRCSEDLQGFNERVTLHAQTIVLQYYLPEIVYRVFL